MALRKIKKGDQVIVIAGKDKGKQGTVLRVIDDKVVVENINIVKKHTKANPTKGEQGGILDKEMPLGIDILKGSKGQPADILLSKNKIILDGKKSNVSAPSQIAQERCVTADNM